jgi:hypothetical protein
VETAAFRDEYRKRAIGPRYSGWLHFAFTTIACLAAIGFALSRVRQPSVLELATVPIAFLIANAAEYFGHKGPMHRAAPGLRLIFQRHTLDHHHFFTHESMACESSRDFQIMLFPPILLIFFFGAIAGPLAALLFFFVSANAGWLFLAVGMGYFLTYEWLHFCYHLTPDSRVGRIGVVRALRRHHATHHDLAKMGRYNFNITFPICDSVFGTTYRAEARPR